MLSEIKLVVRQKNKVIETVVKETNADPKYMVKSLEEFQRNVNSVLTHLIESGGDTAGGDMDFEDGEESEDDSDKDIPDIPKKKRK